MPGSFKNLREIWEKSVKPLFIKAPPAKNLFGHRYDMMLKLQAGLSPFEKDQMDLFVAIRELDGKVKNYPDYLREASAFCEMRLNTPDSPASQKMDLEKIEHFKTALDLLISSGASVGKQYMDRVRAEMKIPLSTDIRARALNLYRQELLTEIASLRGPKADN